MHSAPTWICLAQCACVFVCMCEFVCICVYMCFYVSDFSKNLGNSEASEWQLASNDQGVAKLVNVDNGQR